MQADLILALRSVLGVSSNYWYPRTLVYADRWEGPGFDVFLRGKSHRQFEVVKRLLKVESKSDLVQRFEAAQAKRGVSQWNFDGWPIPLAAYLNLEKLDTV